MSEATCSWLIERPNSPYTNGVVILRSSTILIKLLSKEQGTKYAQLHKK